MSIGASVAKNTAIQFTARGIGTVLGVIAIGTMTRALGPDGFGAYTTVTSFLQVFGVLVDFGLTIIALKLISEPNANEPRILGNILSMRVLTALIFLGIAPVVAWFFPYAQEIKIGILITTLSFLSIAVHQILVSLFQRHLKMQNAAFAEVSGRVVLVGAVIFAFVTGKGLLGMLVATIAANIVQLIVAWILAKRLVRLRFQFDLELWKKIFKLSWPIGLSITFNLIYLRADAVILSVTRSQAELGLYGAAYRVIDVLTVIPFLFMGLILPLLVTSWGENNRKRFAHLMQRAIDFLLMLIIPVVAGGIILGKEVMILVAGSAFSESGAFLTLLLFGVAMIFWGAAYGHAIIALDKQRTMLPWYALNAAIALGMYLFFIPQFGAWAAAIITVVSEFFIALAAAIVVHRTSNARFSPRILIRVTASALGMLVVLLGLKQLVDIHVLISLIIGVMLYFLFLLVFQALTPKDLRMMKSRWMTRS